MATEAQRKASRAYQQRNCTQVLLRLNTKTERDIIEALEASGNKAGYLKRLVREDLARRAGK